MVAKLICFPLKCMCSHFVFTTRCVNWWLLGDNISVYPVWVARGLILFRFHRNISYVHLKPHNHIDDTIRLAGPTLSNYKCQDYIVISRVFHLKREYKVLYLPKVGHDCPCLRVIYDISRNNSAICTNNSRSNFLLAEKRTNEQPAPRPLTNPAINLHFAYCYCTGGVYSAWFSSVFQPERPSATRASFDAGWAATASRTIGSATGSSTAARATYPTNWTVSKPRAWPRHHATMPPTDHRLICLPTRSEWRYAQVPRLRGPVPQRRLPGVVPLLRRPLGLW